MCVQVGDNQHSTSMLLVTWGYYHVCFARTNAAHVQVSPCVGRTTEEAASVRCPSQQQQQHLQGAHTPTKKKPIISARTERDLDPEPEPRLKRAFVAAMPAKRSRKVRRHRVRLRRPPMFKTVLCWDFVTFGKCNYGDCCVFAHGPEDLLKPEFASTFRTRACAEFFSEQGCKHGDKCFFYHGSAPTAARYSRQDHMYMKQAHVPQTDAGQAQWLHAAFANWHLHCQWIQVYPAADDDAAHCHQGHVGGAKRATTLAHGAQHHAPSGTHCGAHFMQHHAPSGTHCGAHFMQHHAPSGTHCGAHFMQQHATSGPNTKAHFPRAFTSVLKPHDD